MEGPSFIAPNVDNPCQYKEKGDEGLACGDLGKQQVALPSGEKIIVCDLHKQTVNRMFASMRVRLKPQKGGRP